MPVTPYHTVNISSFYSYRSPATLFICSCRRVAIALVSIGVAAALCLLYGRFVEPTWLSVKMISLSDTPVVTLIHISDIHYKGDRKYLSKIVTIINTTEADFVCFTGDLVEEKEYLAECMTILSGINKPLYGILGNHDQWAHIRKGDVAEQFAATGGEWLEDGRSILYSNKVNIVGEHSSVLAQNDRGVDPPIKTILLHHYPRIVDHLPRKSYDLILAGHTHGGQIRIPFVVDSVLRESDMAYKRTLPRRSRAYVCQLRNRNILFACSFPMSPRDRDHQVIREEKDQLYIMHVG